MKRHSPLDKRALLLLLSAFLMAFAHPAVAVAQEVPITTSSEEAHALFEKARTMAENLRRQQAIELLEEALAHDPFFPMAHMLLGKIKRDRSEIAVAKESSDDISEGELLLIEIEEALGSDEHQRALELHQKLAQLYPNDHRVQTELGLRYFGRQNRDNALKHLHKAAELAPNYVPACNALGYVYKNLENFEEAESYFKKCIELTPDEPNAHHSYGELLVELNRLDEAIEVFRRTLTIAPRFSRAYLDIGSCLSWKDDHDAARAEYRKFDQAMAGNPDGRTAAAVSYVDQGEMTKALEVIDELYADLLERNDLFRMYQNRTTYGRVLLHFEKPDEALRSFRRAVAHAEMALLPETVKERAWRDHLYFEGLVALAREDLETAEARAQEYRRVVEAAREQRHGPAMAHELAGRLAMAEKNYDQALEELSRSDPSDPYRYLAMGEAYLAKGDRQIAREMIEKSAYFNSNGFAFAFVRKPAQHLLDKL